MDQRRQAILSIGGIIFCREAGAGKIKLDKKIVWSLNPPKNSDICPASSIQLLDDSGIAENGDLQR